MGKTEATQIIRQLQAYQAKVTSSPRRAREALHKAGLITRDGRPAQPYRPDQDAAASSR